MKSSTSDLLAYYGQSDERYIPLGYIESSGTQWIDTGVVPTATTKAALELMWLDNTDTYQRVLGSYTGTYRFHIATSSTSWHPGLGDKYGSAGSANHNVRYVAVLDANTRKFYVDEQQLWEAPAATFASMPSIYLFAQHFGNNAANKACARIYECKLYDGDALIRDFVPMMRVPSNIPGLYDRVEGRFYENMGTGQFVAGPAAIPADYRQVEYIESSKTQYIDTGVKPDVTLLTAVDATVTAYGSLFGTAIVAGNKYYGLNVMGGLSTVEIYYGANGSTKVNIEGLAGQRHNYALQAGNLYIDNILRGSRTGTLDADIYDIYLFRLSGDYTQYIGMKLYRSTVGTVRDFVPVVRNADNKPGLYDLCGSICPLTGTPFYVNAGTGEFTWQELT